MKKQHYMILIGITLLGALLRFINISPFNVYPDSYQSIIVAENIINYHSILGYLGPMGMLYPDFFSWTHPTYPILIILATTITHNMIASARGIALVAGILAIPLAYFFVKRVFSSSVYGLAGAMFLALSFNHTVWSGFLMTETTGVFFMLFLLIVLFTNIETNKSLLQNILIGILFTLAVMTRYEYIVLIIPILFLMFFTYQRPISRILTFPAAFFLTTTAIILLLFPLPSTLIAILSQVHNLILQVLLILFILCLLLGVVVLLPKKQKHFLIKYASILAVVLVWLAFIFFNNYFIHEILLSIFSLIGFSLILTRSQTRVYGFFALLSCALLLPIYYVTNPEMERYVTHLLPFLLIPASYGLIQVLKIIRKKKPSVQFLLLTPIILLFIIQMLLTYSGMRSSQDASWYRTSYEDKSATLVKKYISDDTDILIASYPEPYYYILHLSTQSISDTYPYIFLNNLPANEHLIIIDDMGMHTDFPNFNRFINKNLSKNKIATFWVNEKFHYVAAVQKEKYPVVVYTITLKELEIKIKHSR